MFLDLVPSFVIVGLDRLNQLVQRGSVTRFNLEDDKRIKYTHQVYKNCSIKIKPTLVMARQLLVFLLATRPSLALFFTMQYGTPILRQRAGRNRTS